MRYNSVLKTCNHANYLLQRLHMRNCLTLLIMANVALEILPEFPKDRELQSLFVIFIPNHSRFFLF